MFSLMLVTLPSLSWGEDGEQLDSRHEIILYAAFIVDAHFPLLDFSLVRKLDNLPLKHDIILGTSHEVKKLQF